MTGRPSDYSEELALEICELLSDGKTLVEITAMERMPNRATVYRWTEKHEAFRDMYTRAREFQADSHADEVTHIADNAKDAALARVQIDARKWAAAKGRPKRYGDKLDLNHSGKVKTVTKIELVAPGYDDSEA